MNKIDFIALYLPQFHPIPENDKWWGKGFTEWTNVTKAKPLFKGHYQPRVPADLGFYDLRIPEVREAQASLAKKYGITAFCYWHYWFGNGKRLLHRPFDEVIKSGKPDFPICLAWANESWAGNWHGVPDKILMKQEYPGKKDNEAHFFTLLEAFLDKRYYKIDGKPLFVIYRPNLMPGIQEFVENWQNLAIKNGLPGMYLIGRYRDPHPQFKSTGLDAAVFSRENYILFNKRPPVMKRIWRRLIGHPVNTYSYKEAAKYFLVNDKLDYCHYPTAINDWDNSARTGKSCYILTKASPDLFEKNLLDSVNHVKARKTDRNIVFLKSWNEWAEGNYLEPDIKQGMSYLERILKVKNTIEVGE